MALNTDVPQWLVQQNMWEQQDASASVKSLVSDYFEGQRMGMQKQQQVLSLKSSLLGIQQQQQALDLNKIKLDNTTTDAATIPNWLKDHPTWESRQDAEWPTALTPQGESQLAQIRLRDAQSIQQKAAVAAVGDFSKRVNALSKSDPAAAGQFAPYIGKANPSPDILKALSMAEQTVALKQQNEKEQSALEAQARGDVQTTVVTPKGVTDTFKPAPAGAKGSTQFKPEEPVMLQDGAQLIHVSPNRWQYVKGSNKTDLTPEQKRNVAHELLALNAKDPRGLKILDELASMATAKPAQKPGPSSTGTQDPLNLFGK